MDPGDDDSDDDGILDGYEDTNRNGVLDPGETDPCNPDSDGDFLPDGLEIGLTAPQGTGTDPGAVYWDEDPATTTDPLRADTDGDGLTDGEEDVNVNGMVDPGENDPLTYAACPLGIIASFKLEEAAPPYLDYLGGGSACSLLRLSGIGRRPWELRSSFRRRKRRGRCGRHRPDSTGRLPMKLLDRILDA